MKIVGIKLCSLWDAKHLVQVCEKVSYETDLLWGRYVVDAKSMLGVLSLPQFEEAKLQIHSEDCRELLDKLEELGISCVEKS